MFYNLEKTLNHIKTSANISSQFALSPTEHNCSEMLAPKNERTKYLKSLFNLFNTC